MRGEHALISGIPQAVAVLDLALAGVHAEMAETPFDWFAVPAAPAAKIPVPVVDMKVAATPAEVRTFAPLTPDSEKGFAAALTAPAPEKRAVIPVVEVAGEIWEDGEAGGVLLVMQGMKPEGRALQLAQAMMAAVGLGSEALAMVGYQGKVDGKDLRVAMMGKAPQQVLLLGQAPLGTLLGRNLGVEGWHAAGGGAIPEWDGGPVGVTYPLELLMKQPLFKRLAWQHLLSWGETTKI